MRVHLIKRQTIEQFIAKNARARSSFQNWLTVVRFADWNKPEDIRKTFGAADLLGNGSERIVFDLGGNNYRMICKYVFGDKQLHLFVCWIGTHAEYDKLCADNQQYNINSYLVEETMETLKYKIIKSEDQYQEYVSKLEQLLVPEPEKSVQEEVELLTLLIEKWDEEHNSFELADPIQLLRSLMVDNRLKNKDLVSILGVSKGLVSDILNYKKGLSKEIIRTLAKHFSLSQEAFNRPYKLKLPINAHLRNSSVMNTAKEIA